MEYLGIKRKREFIVEQLLHYESTVEDHKVFYDYNTSPKIVHYIHIEQFVHDPSRDPLFHVFEVGITVDSSLDELFKKAESFVTMILSFERAVLKER